VKIAATRTANFPTLFNIANLLLKTGDFYSKSIISSSVAAHKQKENTIWFNLDEEHPSGLAGIELIC
jgi:hypothetical protein